jgi:hypothetical protein
MIHQTNPTIENSPIMTFRSLWRLLQKIKYKTSCISPAWKQEFYQEEFEMYEVVRYNSSTNGFCPFSWGWSKAGCRWDKTQSIRSPSGLCSDKQEPNNYMLNLQEQNRNRGNEVKWGYIVLGTRVECLNWLDSGLVNLIKTLSYNLQLL